MTWVPRSRRDDHGAAEEWQGPFPGVPAWLAPHLDAWMKAVFYRGAFYGVETFWSEGLRRIQLDLHLTLDWSRGDLSAVRSLTNYRVSNVDTYLDIVDWCIGHLDDRELLGTLQTYLDSAASLYTVSHMDGVPPALVERVLDSVSQAVQWSAPPSSRAAAYLGLAWNHTYGRVKNPSSAYRDAIRAVEAAAKPIVSPANDLTTLGTIIRDMTARPDKWRIALTPETGIDPISTLIGQMRFIWKGQLDRHGTDDESVPLGVSIEEAEVAVHFAALLVHLFTSGAVIRI